jgi:hypothetical protein
MLNVIEELVPASVPGFGVCAATVMESQGGQAPVRLFRGRHESAGD